MTDVVGFMDARLAEESGESRLVAEWAQDIAPDIASQAEWFAGGADQLRRQIADYRAGGMDPTMKVVLVAALRGLAKQRYSSHPDFDPTWGM